MTIDKCKFSGTDADKITSLCEYGLLVAPYEDDGNKDEYFVVYKIGPDTYDTGFKQEIELNNLINGKEWANEADIEGFLSFVGATKEEWLTNTFMHKIHDCISYWGYEEIMGTSYYGGMPEAEAIERYIS